MTRVSRIEYALKKRDKHKIKCTDAKYCFNKYQGKETFLLMERVRQKCLFDWQLIQTVQYHDYIWWSYPNFKLNERFNLFSDALVRDSGTLKCIIKILQLINEITFFNKEIKEFVWVLTFCQEIFTYYNRFYRYQHNEKLFGKKKFLNYRHGHKLHFISCIKNRELTGARLNKNHLAF